MMPIWLIGQHLQWFLMLTDGTKAQQKQLYYLYQFLGLEHAWLLGNRRIRQNVTISSLNVSFNPHNEHI